MLDKQKIQRFIYSGLDSFFSFCNFMLKSSIKYPFLILGFLIILLLATAALLINNNLNVGGYVDEFLTKFGLKKDSKSKITQANSIPKNREQAIGEADKRGYVQHRVEELPTSKNPFRDKTKVELPSGEKVKLPEGLTDKDIDVIIQTKAEVVVVPKPSVYDKLNETSSAIKSAEETNLKTKKLLENLKNRKK